MALFTCMQAHPDYYDKLNQRDDGDSEESTDSSAASDAK